LTSLTDFVIRQRLSLKLRFAQPLAKKKPAIVGWDLPVEEEGLPEGDPFGGGVKSNHKFASLIFCLLHALI
jgi:hypothetical protein